MLSFILIPFFLSSVTAFTTIRFSSIRQCGPFNVTFLGTQQTALPLTLTVVPFDSSAVPLSILLPNPAWRSKASVGVAITFLPYPAGTTFIASLDDAQGWSTGFTSDIIRILQSDDMSCVSTAEKAQTYATKPPFSQCQPFNVTFDPIQAVPPIVRLFVPNGQALLLNQTGESFDPGTIGFTMAAFRGQPAVLLFKDGSDRLQSTDLFTVKGDVTSSNRCFPARPDGRDSEKAQQAGLSRQAVIGITASIASVVTLLSILIAVHFLLRWRTQRTAHQTGIEGGLGLTKPGASLPLDSRPAQSLGNVINIINKPTPYPMERYTSTPTSPSFVQSIPNNYVVDCHQRMQSLNTTTADLDQILNASFFMPNDGTKTWSSILSPSTRYSQGAQSTEPSIGKREQPKATIPISPLSSVSNFGDSITPAGYVRTGITEVDSGTGVGRDRTVARRSSTVATAPEKTMIIHCGGRGGYGDSYL